jgi:hypothetical protein
MMSYKQYKIKGLIPNNDYKILRIREGSESKTKYNKNHTNYVKKLVINSK